VVKENDAMRLESCCTAGWLRRMKVSEPRGQIHFGSALVRESLRPSQFSSGLVEWERGIRQEVGDALAQVEVSETKVSNLWSNSVVREV